MIVSEVTYLGNSKFSHDDLAKNWTCIISSSSKRSAASSKKSAAPEKTAEASEEAAAEPPTDGGGVLAGADPAPVATAAPAPVNEADDSDDDLPVLIKLSHQDVFSLIQERKHRELKDIAEMAIKILEDVENPPGTSIVSWGDVVG